MSFSRSAARRSANAAFAIATCAAMAKAQDADRFQRPGVQPAPSFQFPKAESQTLPNGLRVVVVEDHSIPVVAARAVLGVDSTADPVGKSGLFAVTMSALREGTTSKTADQLNEAFADLGSTVKPDSFTVIAADFPRAMALMGDMLMHPRFDQAAIDRRKTAQAANVRRLAAQPTLVARRALYAVLYGADDAVARSTAPNEADVATITRDDVVRFYDDHVGPQRTTIIITGDVASRAALAEVRRVLGEWREAGHHGSAPAMTGSPAPSPRATTIYLRDVPGTQAVIYIARLGPTRTAPDAAAADVMSAIAATRMFHVLREQRSFMYSGAAAVAWMPAQRPSPFYSAAAVSVAKVDSALVDWLALLRGLRAENPATAREVAAARRNIVGVLPARIDGPEAVAARVAELVRDGLPTDYLTSYAAGLSAVTPSDVTAAASKYIDPDHLAIVVVGDRKVIEPSLRAANLAPMVIVE